MARLRIDWKLRAFEQIRRSAPVRAELMRQANSIAAEAGEGYEAVAGEGRTRSRAAVVTSSFASARDNSRNNTLNRIIARRRVRI